MNELRRIGTTDSGNALFLFPHGGNLVYFEAVDYDTLRIHMVDVLDGADQVVSEWDSFEELPAPIRRAISTSQYRLRSTATSLEGAMS